MKRLNSTDIHYLAFEGGGGSGNVYPGALKALQQLSILKYDTLRPSLPPNVTVTPDVSLTGSFGVSDWALQDPIEGVSGASAGAINALFLALGYTPAEIEFILLTNNFNTFFDPIRPGLNPHVGGFRVDHTSFDMANFYGQFGETTAGTMLNELTNDALLRMSASPAGVMLGGAWVSVLGVFADLPKSVVDQLTANLKTGMAQVSAVYDFGLFPGLVVRQFFARYTSLAVERILHNRPGYNLQATAPAGPYGPSTNVDAGVGQWLFDSTTKAWARTSEITFRQHHEIFGTRLVVTGTNLETQKSHLFSADTTPNFRVVDAVRISMSLPLIFKPLIIRDASDLEAVVNPGDSLTNHPLKGVWVDGGLFNNIPVGAFDDAAGGQGHTLGLTVGFDEHKEIDNIFKYLKVYPLGIAIGGTGGSQVSSTTSEFDRIIILSITELNSGKDIGLMDFVVEPTIYSAINKQSTEAVELFFATRAD